MDPFESISPLDYRYLSPGTALHGKAAAYLSENARIRYQARVEAALAKALAKHGVCPASAAREIERAAKRVKAAEVYAEEAKIKHDVRALANVLRAKVSAKARPFVHLAATSYDIVDTASALRYKDAALELLVPSLKKLENALIDLALREKNTIQVGRTHGQFAEPITFGFAVSEYVSRLGNRIREIEEAADNVCGKFSGAVGAYNASSLLIKDPEKLEADILKELGLKRSTHSTQIVEPESLSDLVHAVASAFGVLANFADDMRHLQRSEIGEIAEAFTAEQVGSSTMPHKRNPVSFENVKSLWKQFMPRILTVYMDAVSEHQRDLTNSASARFLPELFAGLFLASEKLSSVVSRLHVDWQRMKANFVAARNALAAEPLYVLLAKHGHEDAHEVVRKLTLKAESTGENLFALAEADPALRPPLQKFSAAEKSLVREPQRYTGLAERKTVSVCRHWKKALSGRSLRKK